MAVDLISNYVAQQAEHNGQTQTGGVSYETQRKSRAADGKRAGQDTVQDIQTTVAQEKAVAYDVSQRTNEIAAWYQDFLLQEQEAQLGMETEEEAVKEDEEDPVKKKLEENEKILKSLQQMLERMRESQKKQKEQKKKSKKKLSYSYRKVSSAISGAKTSLQASNALSSAMASLGDIKRKAATGNYEEKDIQIALQHAQRMVRTARKKVNNLKSEVQQKQRHTAIESQKKQERKLVYRAPDRQKVEAEITRLEKELRAQQKQKKNRNRRQEDMDLMQADMQYLRRKIDLLRQEGYSLSGVAPENDEMLAAALGLVTIDRKEEAIQAQENSGQTVETTPVEISVADAGTVVEE